MVIRDVIRHYDELLAGRFGSSTRDGIRSATETYDAKWYGRPMCTALRPHFLGSRAYAGVLEAITRLTRGLRAAAERLALDRSLRAQIGLPAYLEPLIEIDRDHGEYFVIGRFDGYLTEDGQLTCFEFNALPGTLTISHEATSAFDGLPIAAEFAKRYPFRTEKIYDRVFDAVHADHARRGRTGPPSLTTLRSSPEICAYAQWMRWVPFLASRGCQVLSATEDELTLGEDGKLYARDMEVDQFVFANWEELLGLTETAPALFEAIGKGTVRPFDGLSRGLLCNNKATFEVLTDPVHEDLFPAEVTAALRRHLPWTRMLRETKTRHGDATVDLLPFVEAHREGLVIKPSGGNSGAGVVLGWAVDAATWRRAIRDGVAAYHVVQQRARGASQMLPMLEGDTVVTTEQHCDLDTYVWNARVAQGCLVRICPLQVTNMGVGATSIPLWILDETP